MYHHEEFNKSQVGYVDTPKQDPPSCRLPVDPRLRPKLCQPDITPMTTSLLSKRYPQTTKIQRDKIIFNFYFFWTVSTELFFF